MTDKLAIYQTTYDQSKLRLGIVHLGYGAFHRAHQSVYIDDYIEAQQDFDWGIAAVNLRDSESAEFAKMAATMTQRKKGYVLKTMTPEGKTDYRRVRSHIKWVDWTTETTVAEQLLAFDSVKIVTITVTESGYYLKGDGVIDFENPIIAHELAGGETRSIYGYLANALKLRAESLNQPITILCCDNIRANGRMLEENFLAYLHQSPWAKLVPWVRANTTFPCTMVDRITPRANAALMTEISTLLPDQEPAPVHAEDFKQWVIENKPAGPFPDIETVGVQLVDDVDPYEEAKIRILNGGHTGLAYLGALAGYTTFDQAMHDPALRAHIDNWEIEEVLPGLTLDLPFDKTAYWHSIAARFSNSAIADLLERICMDGWSKMPIFIQPTLAACLAQGIVPRYGFDCIASWYIYARRAATGKVNVPYHEPYEAVLTPLLAQGKEAEFAKTPILWGNLAENYESFVPGIVTAIAKMDEKWPA